MAKIGRNDPCPCGSGKKYKRCCYNEESQPSIPPGPWEQDAAWYKIRRTEGESIEAILGFGLRRYGEAFLDEALAEFSLWGEYQLDDLDFDNFFIPWVVFNWIPRKREREPAPRTLSERPLGLEYLRANTGRVNAYQEAFIRSACSQPFSFFVITDVTPGKSMGLRDVILGRTFTLKEASASKVVERGDIVFCRVVPLEDQAIVVGLGSIPLLPREHLHLLDLRDSLGKRMRRYGLKLDVERLLDLDLQMRRVYLGVVEALRHPPPPELQNTDGEPLVFVKLHFDLACSPQEAVEGLKSLALPEFQDDILNDSVNNAEGDLLEVSFDWQKEGNKLEKHWTNTVLGNLTIRGNALTVQVNSEKRAKKIKSEIKKRLGKKAAFKEAVYESVESKLGDGRLSDDARREREELESLPEVQAILKQEAEAHWETWYNEPIPALKNKTPVEAARTQAGRERLEALLSDYERMNERASQPYQRVDVQAIRKRLGL